MKSLKIGITHGDINGIGYELILKLLQEPEILELCTPVIFGCQKVADETAQALNLSPLSFCLCETAADALEGRINLIDVCKEEVPVLSFGKQTEEALKAEANSLMAALEAYRNHHIDVLVTLPGGLSNTDGSHSLSNFISRALGMTEAKIFDWSVNGKLRVLELHALDASTELGEGLLSEAFQQDIKAVHNGLRQDCMLLRPRIAVVSSIEKTRGDLIELHEDGITAFGPFVGKTFIDNGWQTHYDACLFFNEEEALQHVFDGQEQEHTIGYVSGLPVVLTYPMLGISYEIAGKGEVSEVSLREAIYAAIDIYRARSNYRYCTHSPLEKQWIPRGRDDVKLDLTKEE